MAAPTQVILIAGYYRCHNCGRDVAHVRKERRFWLCNDCWQEIVAPTAPGIAVDYDSDERRARSRYWDWYSEMEQRYPARRNWRPAIKKYVAPDISAFWPYCRRCGAKTIEYEFSTKRSLLGGHRRAFCTVCDAKNGVESVIRMADGGIVHPDWDDEDWLDLLWKSQREAFDLGVLPDYWFELRRQVGTAGLPA